MEILGLEGRETEMLGAEWEDGLDFDEDVDDLEEGPDVEDLEEGPDLRELEEESDLEEELLRSDAEGRSSSALLGEE